MVSYHSDQLNALSLGIGPSPDRRCRCSGPAERRQALGREPKILHLLPEEDPAHRAATFAF